MSALRQLRTQVPRLIATSRSRPRECSLVLVFSRSRCAGARQFYVDQAARIAHSLRKASAGGHRKLWKTSRTVRVCASRRRWRGFCVTGTWVQRPPARTGGVRRLVVSLFVGAAFSALSLLQLPL